MDIVIVGGTGFIGQFMVNRYLKQGHSVTVVGRSEKKIESFFPKGVRAVNWKTFNQYGYALLSNCNLLINLSGAGIADQRWTKKRKQHLLESRIATTQQIVKICSELKICSPPLFNASAIGIYGIQTPQENQLPPPLDETTQIPNDSSLFSVQLVKAWEAQTQPLKTQGIRVVNLRFGVVLGKSGGALEKLKFIFQCGFGGKVGSGNQPFSWIHIEDLCRAIDFLFLRPDIHGPVNLVAPECVTQKKFSHTLGKVLHRPSFITTPAFALKVFYGQMAKELLLNGQHVIPAILDQLDFHFNYPELKPALRSIF